MPIGVLTNCASVLAGGVIGSALGHILPASLKEHLPTMFGLCSIAIGMPSPGVWRLRFNSDATIYSDDFGDFDSFDLEVVAGDYDEEHRTMIEGGVWRDGEPIFEGLSLNEVVVSRGATASMADTSTALGCA